MSDSFVLRTAILDTLVKIEQKSGFSHLVISHEINRQNLSQQDEGLFTEVVYGTINRKLTLDYYLDAFLKNGQKLKPWVRMLLRMSVYQMVYLDKVPDHAIFHEAVEIAKKRGHKGIASLVNGVLRNLQRKGVPSTADITPESRRIAIATSHPEWLVDRWMGMYGAGITEQMCKANLHHKPVAIRVQILKTTRAALKSRLESEGFVVCQSRLSPQGLIIEQGNILTSNVLTEGLATIQDQSSMLVGDLLDAKEGMNVLDACSAPGGKTTHIAETMNDTGHIQAYDLHEKKAGLVKEKAETLGLTNVTTVQADARQLRTIHQDESFDRILVDAPCSGFGVIRGKPDIKYSKHADDIDNLSNIQMDILHETAPLLKQGGQLIYSTCTVNKTENEDVIEQFLSKHSDFAVDGDFWGDLPECLQHTAGRSAYGLQIFPYSFETDGFFLVRLIKQAHQSTSLSQGE